MLLVLDGGLATQVEKHLGYVLDTSLWSAQILIEKPELIEEVHYEYYLAGADAAITSSYQACFENLRESGCESPEDILLQSVKVAATARDRAWKVIQREKEFRREKPLVIASCGCFGAVLADGSVSRGIQLML